jgi:hypothetical protein
MKHAGTASIAVPETASYADMHRIDDVRYPPHDVPQMERSARRRKWNFN